MRSFWLVLAMSGFTLTSQAEQSFDEEAKLIVQEFVGQLKPTLKRALQQGPVEAVNTCAKTAPEIARKMSQNGWQVKRVSSKARNPAATPDAWEQAALKTLASRLAEGATGAKLNYSETIDGEFRYMQGQVTEAMCLVCHGQTIAPDIHTAIKQHFPEDAATGYVANELRGGISLRKPL